MAKSVTQATGGLELEAGLSLGAQLACFYADWVSALRLGSTWIVVGNFHSPGWLRRRETVQGGNSAAKSVHPSSVVGQHLWVESWLIAQSIWPNQVPNLGITFVPGSKLSMSLYPYFSDDSYDSSPVTAMPSFGHFISWLPCALLYFIFIYLRI